MHRNGFVAVLLSALLTMAGCAHQSPPSASIRDSRALQTEPTIAEQEALCQRVRIAHDSNQPSRDYAIILADFPGEQIVFSIQPAAIGCGTMRTNGVVSSLHHPLLLPRGDVIILKSLVSEDGVLAWGSSMQGAISPEFWNNRLDSFRSELQHQMDEYERNNSRNGSAAQYDHESFDPELTRYRPYQRIDLDSDDVETLYQFSSALFELTGDPTAGVFLLTSEGLVILNDIGGEDGVSLFTGFPITTFIVPTPTNYQAAVDRSIDLMFSPSAQEAFVEERVRRLPTDALLASGGYELAAQEVLNMLGTKVPAIGELLDFYRHSGGTLGGNFERLAAETTVDGAKLIINTSGYAAFSQAVDWIREPEDLPQDIQDELRRWEEDIDELPDKFKDWFDDLTDW